MSRFRGLSIVLMLILGWGWAHGQEKLGPQAGVYGWRSFLADQGLRTPAITSLVQDWEGYLWAGTEDGLFRLEGNEFKQHGEGGDLPNSYVNVEGLSSGVTRGLWVSTAGGASYWNGSRFLHPSELGLPGLDSCPGRCVSGGGMILWDEKAKGHFLSMDGEAFKPMNGLPWGLEITCAFYDRPRRRLFVAMNEHLWSKDPGGSWVHRDLGSSLGQEIRGLCIDPQGGIWVRSAERIGFLRELAAPLELLHPPLPLSMVQTASVNLDAQGRLWLNTAQGLLFREGQTWTLLDDKAGLPRGGAVIQYLDDQGVLWIGAYGVHKLLGDGLWSGWTKKEGLPADMVWTALRTRDGRLWAGTTGGLATLEAGGWRTLAGTRANQIYSLTEDDDGNLWVGHTPSRERPSALSVLPKGGRELKPQVLTGLPPKNAISCVVAEKGILWLATGHNGIWRAERHGTSLTARPVPISSWPLDTAVERLALDGKGGLFAAGTPGIAHWDGTTWVTLDKASGLPDNKAMALAVVPETGEAWVGFSETKGLVRVRREGDHLVLVESLKLPHPLVKEFVFSLICSPGGILWAGTSLGVVRWDGKRGELFDGHDGLPGEDCTQGGIWLDTNGDLYVGLSDGLGRGRMQLRRGDRLPPPAKIFSASRGDGVSLLGAPGPTEVPWSSRTLSFRFGARGSAGTEELRFQVRLAGFEQTWLTTKISEARYTGLPPGNYRFEVRTLNALGEVGPTEALGLRVLPPLWRKPWMLALEAVALVVLAYAAFRLRLASLEKRNRELASMVAMRTHALEQSIAEVTQANKDLLAAIAEVRTLQGLLPICANCKKIRDDKGIWEQIEGYISRHSEASFSHGICPDCAEEFFPGSKKGS